MKINCYILLFFLHINFYNVQQFIWPLCSLPEFGLNSRNLLRTVVQTTVFDIIIWLRSLGNNPFIHSWSQFYLKPSIENQTLFYLNVLYLLCESFGRTCSFGKRSSRIDQKKSLQHRRVNALGTCPRDKRLLKTLNNTGTIPRDLS